MRDKEKEDLRKVRVSMSKPIASEYQERWVETEKFDCSGIS
jgi:hypothetical protein